MSSPASQSLSFLFIRLPILTPSNSLTTFFITSPVLPSYFFPSYNPLVLSLPNCHPETTPNSNPYIPPRRRPFRTARTSRRNIDNATTDAQVFKFMQWAKPKSYQEPHPLKAGEDRWLSDPLERAESLRDTPIARFNANQDLSAWKSGQPESIPWNSTLSIEDVKMCNVGSGDNAPGTDKITVWLLKACWMAIREHVRDIFQACLEHGHLPTAFRVAEVNLLPKPGRNLSTSKGWQPISLLSCLGKGLERLVANGMAWLAIEHQVIPQQLFGAFSGRSAVDLVSCVRHDAEATMRNNKFMAMITLDVQGALDAVQTNACYIGCGNKGGPRYGAKGSHHF